MAESDDRQRLTELFDQYYDALVGSLSGWMPREDARDVAQDTFLAVYKSMDKYRGDARWAYLKTAALRLAKNRHRDRTTQKRDERLERPVEAADKKGDGKPSAEEQLIRDEETRLFGARYQEALMELPELTRRCFLLRWRGESSASIATATGLTNDAVRSRISAARDRLLERVGKAPHEIDWQKVADDEHES
jgi:RNA polymerase sigma-70 factor (ECF subfamily)